MGALIVITGLIFILLIHEAGHLFAAKRFGMKVTEYFLGFGPTVWSKKIGETEYGIKAIPAGGFVRIIGMNPLEQIAEEDEGRSYRSRPFYQKSAVVMAGIFTHFVIAFILIWIANVMIGEPNYENLLLEVSSVIELDENGKYSGAYTSGLQSGDKILGLNGENVENWDSFASALRSMPNESVYIHIDRKGEEITTNVILTSKVDLEGKEVGFLGVAPEVSKIRQSPLEGIWISMGDVVKLTVMSAAGLWGFVSNLGNFVEAIFGNEAILDEVRPVSVLGVAQIGAASQKAGLNFTLELLAYISIFVALLNTVPLYPFDGGHLAVAAYEKVTGRSVDIKKLMPLTAFVICFLVFIGLLGLYFDIVNPIQLG